MSKIKQRPPRMHHFIDEAGDLSLFNKRKQVVVGTEGVSNYFMVGAAFVPDPESLESELAALRRSILEDPLLNRIPSLDLARKKTAIAFHAKDDAPEIRYKVFSLLANFDVRMFVAVRTKRALIDEARFAFRRGIRLTENEIYDDLISRLLRNRLHLRRVERDRRRPPRHA